MLQLGDITVTRSWVVTPNGTRALRGTTWIASDNSRTEQAIPTWAIVMAIVFALLCLLGLLFLLVKETRTVGYVQVTVQAEGFFHATQIPVSSPDHVAWVRQQVAHAQGLAAQAPTI
jgi:hypothetical protein